MDALQESFVPWRERAFVTVAEASSIFARSTSWVRDRLTDNSLEPATLPGGGPTAVTVASVLRLIAKGTPKRDVAPDIVRANPRKSCLRLVVDNDWK
jgi:hypothetical protein